MSKSKPGDYKIKPLYSPKRAGKLAKKSLWDNNEIQFARLLCEVVANWGDEIDTKHIIKDVARSMDLTVDEVNTLFDRAETVWEASKAKHCPVRR